GTGAGGVSTLAISPGACIATVTGASPVLAGTAAASTIPLPAILSSAAVGAVATTPIFGALGVQLLVKYRAASCRV
ncbi:MAG: hypothetical protein RSD82_12255, partial [Comamonas sp.]